MTQVCSLPLNIGKKIFIQFRVRDNVALPADAQGRSVLQVHGPACGGGEPGKRLFGGDENPTHVKAFLSFYTLRALGYVVNNIYLVVDPDTHARKVCTWLEYDASGALAPNACETAIAFVAEQLAYAYNKVAVYENGSFYSINMIDRLKKEKDPEWRFAFRRIGDKSVARVKPSKPATLNLAAVQPSPSNPKPGMTSLGDALVAALEAKR